MAQLCLQKYASNVMEKALKVENIRTVIVKELLVESKIKEIIGNQYGCYVLRTCSLVCEDKSKGPLLANVKDALGNIIAPKLKPLWKEIMDNLSRF